MKHCTNCGTMLEDGALFCSECGQPQPAPPSAAPAMTTVEPPMYAVPPEPPKKKKTSILIPIVIIVAVIGVLLGGVGVALGLGAFDGLFDGAEKPRVGSDDADDSPSIVEQAKEAIADGDLGKAYTLLKDADSEEAKALFAKFIYVPVKGRSVDGEEEQTWQYDTNGNIIKMEYTYASGSWYCDEFTYDEKGRLSTHNVNTDGEETTKSYVYNDDGTVKRMYRIDDDGYEQVTEHTYDANGRLKTSTTRTEAVTAETTYTYDANGNLIKEVLVFSDGDENRHTYLYDAFGNLIEETTVYYDGDRTTYEYTYDAKGNRLTKSRKDSDGYSFQYTYSYNEDGVRTGAEYHVDWNGKTLDKTYEYTAELMYYPNGVPEQIEDIVENW